MFVCVCCGPIQPVPSRCWTRIFFNYFPFLDRFFPFLVEQNKGFSTFVFNITALKYIYLIFLTWYDLVYIFLHKQPFVKEPKGHFLNSTIFFWRVFLKDVQSLQRITPGCAAASISFFAGTV